MWLKYLFYAGLKYSISTKGYKSKKLTQTPELTIFFFLNFEVTHILFYVYALVTEVNSFVMSSFPINMSFISYST